MVNSVHNQVPETHAVRMLPIRKGDIKIPMLDTISTAANASV